jgi:7-cyano-7-deazaguanine synthase in queuosine biosynthesis
MHTWFADVQTNRELGKLPAEFLCNKKISKLYIGDTCYPPDEINRQFAENGHDVFQNMVDRNPNITRNTGLGPFYYPFTNHNKKKIAEIYTQENILDLFSLTRSCESEENIGTQHCGKCWWCQERMWAFGKL